MGEAALHYAEIPWTDEDNGSTCRGRGREEKNHGDPKKYNVYDFADGNLLHVTFLCDECVMGAKTSGSSGDLHMFTADGEEWVIAFSSQDARNVYCAHIGCEPDEDNPDGCDHGCHTNHWEQLPHDQVLKRASECPELHTLEAPECPSGCDDNFIIHEEMTCAAWAAKEGRGHHASANA